MVDILKMSDEDACWYVLHKGGLIIPAIHNELFKSHDIFSNLATLISSIDMLPCLIAGSGLSGGLDCICCSELPDSKARIQAYVDFLTNIGAFDFAKIFTDSIKVAVPYNDSIPDSVYRSLQDKLENSYYDKDNVPAKIGAYFKSLVANENNKALSIDVILTSSAHEHEIQPSIIGEEESQSLPMTRQIYSDDERPGYIVALKLIEQCLADGSHELDLRGLGLRILPPEIDQLTKVKSLDVGSNSLVSLPPQLGKLTALEKLFAPANQLTSLPPEIGGLSSLTHLDLEANELTSLPPEIGKLSALKFLNLSINPQIKLPQEIVNLISLNCLDLRWNQMGELPPQIFELTSLNELILWENQLSILPSKIGNLAALTTLDLRGNQLNSLPPEIGQLTSLKELNLSHNQLTSLPLEIGQLIALKSFSLADNELITLPPVITGLTSLTFLDLRGCQLSHLQPEMVNLTALSELFLHDNPELDLPEEVLGEETIDDDFNELSEAIPRDILNYYFAQQRREE